jgi:hypothetical protein
MKIKNLKTWDDVKDKKHKTSSLRHGESPSDFLYQNSNGLYSPAIKVEDFKEFRDMESTRWGWNKKQ